MTTREEALSQLTSPGGLFELEQITNEKGTPLRVYKSGPKTLREVLLATAAHGDAIYVVYEDERISFSEHLSRVASLAQWLVDKGVGKGDRVAIGMRNYPEWVMSFWACQAIGAVTVTLNAWWTGPELVYGLTDSGSRVAILDDERFARLEPHLGELSSIEVLVTRDPGRPGIQHFEDVVAERHALPEVALSPSDYATIIYTSGTTGFPKGALHTHRNHITNIQNSMLSGALAAMIVPPATEAADPQPEQPASLQTFPFFHIGGLSGLYLSATVGIKMVLMYRWDVSRAIDLIVREKVKSWAGVPTVVRQVLEHPRAAAGDLDSLASIASGGAPVPEDLINRVGEMFKARVAPGNGYGATETTSAIIANGGADYLAHPGSVGRPTATIDVRVVDEDGNDVAQGDVGEVWVRGPNIFEGYWKKPKETEESFAGGWFKTGDLGFEDAEGFYYIVDRKKDVIIRGGENIYCAEVEGVLFKHPGVADVALIGLPHRELGEEVVAVIEPKTGASISEDDVQAFVAERLARFNVPTRVFFLDEPLPRTATGKILKRELKQRFS